MRSHDNGVPFPFPRASQMPRSLIAPELDVLFWPPPRLGVMSAWWGHVPFMHWLVTSIRPRLAVELGTHHGVSFTALCEAMQRAGIAGHCYAVDTWKGDVHSGYYDERVLAELTAFIHGRYATFADLIRLTFDEAATQFADGSIDLLHIDGLHTYDAVKADFEKWLPKLSDCGVVLLHDINERRDDFGVWKLWADIEATYPSFEFSHGHGLGIVGVGTRVPGALLELCGLDAAAATALRERFAHLGARWAVADAARQAEEHARGLKLANEKLTADSKGRASRLHAERAGAARLAERMRRYEADLAVERSRVAELTEAQRRSLAEREAERGLTPELVTGLRRQEAELRATEREQDAELLASQQEHMASLQQQTAEQASKIVALLGRVGALGLERERATQLAAAQRDEIAVLRSERDRAAAQSDELSDALQQRIADLERERGRVAALARALQQHARDLQAERDRGATRESSHEANIAKLEQLTSQQRDQLRALQQRVEELAIERERAAELSASQFSYIAELETRRANDAAQLGELRSALSPRTGRVSAFLRSLRPVDRRRLAEPQPIAAGDEPTSVRDALSDADLIAATGLFDEGSYEGRREAQALGISAIEHYLSRGEAAGLAPSRRFDPTFYQERYADLQGLESNLLLHFIRHGHAEARTALPAVSDLELPTAGLRHDRETIVVIVHEASRTGAPIIGWNLVEGLQARYNVVALLKRGGAIAQAFLDTASATVTLPDGVMWLGAESRAAATAIAKRYRPLFVIANSAETGAFVPAFERAGVATVALVHEFASYVKPAWAFQELLDTASDIVFPAQIVADAAFASDPRLAHRYHTVLAQGECRPLPRLRAEHSSVDGGAPAQGAQDAIVSLPPRDGSILVLGVGTAIARKGVEFFIAAAASAARRQTARPIVFAWLGQHRGFDEHYQDNLNEQIKRSGLKASFLFLGEVEDVGPVYERADVFFLSSRLDPFPNVAIDAAVRGIPVVCFDQASGIAELLAKCSDTRHLVVPYLDAEAAADRIVELAADPAHHAAASSAMRDLAARHFDMPRYIESLDALGRAAARRRAHVEGDREVIKATRAFNPALYLGRPTTSPFEGLDDYLERSRRLAPRSRPGTDRKLRRPLEGFHPLIYAAENVDYDEASGEDPLAHYARSGFPAGPWRHRVIRPSPGLSAPSGNMRVAVHGHFHYTDRIAELVRRLRRNRTTVDLVLTTHAESVETVTDTLRGLSLERARVEVVPNRGRNVGPFLTGPGGAALSDYDLVVHVHGKRSSWAKPSFGDRWCTFLWESIIGGETAMLDAVVSAFEADDRLGVVFPEDPFLLDWDRNRPFAEDLAARMRLRGPLPSHFEFPVGTMFCARPAALQPLFDLGLRWEDYPDEPVALDGTLLHAIERLIPFSAAQAGYGYATTYVETVFR
jgi:glycosyltransferase involved in cell wall biosynthesis